MFPIKSKISSEKTALENFHKKFPWIPGEKNIRPTESQIKEKEEFFNRILLHYSSIRDYILIEIFNLNSNFDDMGKLKLEIKTDILNNYKFIKNMFPYDLPQNTHHYIMWYSCNNSELNDNIINNNINTELINILGNDKFEFVWYENPKMNIPDIYHVQVFWKLI